MAKRSIRRSPRSSSHVNATRPDIGRLESVQLLGRYKRGTLALGVALALGLPAVADARPANCDPVVDGTVTCRGDQSKGVRSGVDFNASGVTTLEVRELSGPIDGAADDAIVFSGGGNNVIVHSGMDEDAVIIETTATSARGIVATSVGSPANPPESSRDAFLGVFVVGEPDVPGGRVEILSHSSITTDGDRAHGLYAYSSATGYGAAVTGPLESFDAQNFSFVVVEVKNSDGTEGVLGGEIAGVVIDADGNPILDADGNVVTAGTFIVRADGSYEFVRGDDFDALGPDDSMQVAIDYRVRGTNNSSDRTEEQSGRLVATVRRNEDGELEELREAYFDRYGPSARPAAEQPDVFPDLAGFVESLLATARAGAAGGELAVINAGRIETRGSAAYGILAETRGGNGGKGRDGSISHSADPGKPGRDGGPISVTADGEIVTHGAQSIAVAATSRGGDGGHGGDGGTWRYGQRGGQGGDGGTIRVDGAGTIRTDGEFASGILALSIGGDGGTGGSGDFVTGGGRGGYGGMGGAVTVEGSWDITTRGNKAHGIWAKSMGGNAGSGGSGGWAAGSPGGGGQATDGAAVSVISSGAIETFGHDAYGIHAQSVGGFGGKGGGGFSLFYSAGGDGGSAGSGGAVSVEQAEGGSITTHGERAHGVLAQSVGGGGGSGGGTSGLVSVGGEGQAGGMGGAVIVTNAGRIEASGAGAMGIFAESVGGGGGDGGSSAGLAAVGGGGSGTSDGGTVDVINTGTVSSASTAIFAQSIGGGGGNGGSSSGWFSFGGKGGGGGHGAAVTVENSGILATTEANASAIFAQSVGGGGGNGGNSTAVGAFGSLAIGGEGAKGGDGSTVLVDSGSGAISTAGDRSRGIFAQSVGGGGGNGGFAFAGSVGLGVSVSVGLGGKGEAGGTGGDVILGSQTAITTLGADAHGIFAQSVGGGGGAGGFSIAVSGSDGFAGAFSMGGKGGPGGAAGNVALGSLENQSPLTGLIQTAGDHAYGILAQSVGGGGGDGGFSIAAGVSGGVGASLSFGGTGGVGGAGGKVDLFSANLVETRGSDSHGLFAQSVGGGGGSGGFSVTGGLAGGVQLGASFGGDGGNGANAGRVRLSSSGETISTRGNHAYGILAQSIGGSGGDGGFSVAGGISSSASVNFSMGGSGGDAGLGGEVALANNSSVYTLGQDSHGVFAQSVGGGGGSGGFSATGGISAGSAQVGASIGGSGGDGGNADRVSLTSTGELVATAGDRSYGLLAQSVGGSGGAGGFSVAGGISQSASVNFALGGSGGGGGQGGVVELTSSTRVETLGADAHGLFAQSLGGGGGVGGFAVTGGISAQSAQIGAAIGGAGGDGGKASAVTLTGTGETVTTFGDRSYGLLAQSVGGSGGAGGFSIAGGISQSASVNFGLGGSGGEGGAGSTASLTSSSVVQTYGADAHGLFAQSVGGGGGVGGFAVTGGISAQSAQIGAAIGGEGGDGGQAGRVALTSTGELVATSGDRSHGLLAQSIGGSGGAGGFSVAGGISKSAAVNFGLGGSGGEGGAVAGTVSLVSQSNVYTEGLDAHGLFAQSVGGGGGAGGFAVTGGISTGSAQVGASVGGSGGGGAKAGRVNLHSLGQVVSTTGDRSHGILAQSIGGMGGSGGFAIAGGVSKSAAVNFGLGGEGGDGAVAGTVGLVAMSDVYTQGADAYGLFAQSVGGGGGAGGFAVTGGISTESAQVGASVGGSGGGTSRGDKVSLRSYGELVNTAGDRSYGILAQSIGGSGGSGGFAIAGGISKSAAVNFGLGGSGGAGSLGGEVELHSQSSVATRGAGAHGLFAQSVGGGGGAGGFSIAGGVSRENAQISAGLGGSGGGGGDASLVQLFSSGDTIMTAGERAFGILAQSVGGGGGDGGFSLAGGSGKKASINFAMGGRGGTAGTAGSLYLENSSAIYTEGGNSHGILAQSVGGGGGSGGFSATGSLMQGSESKQVSASIGGDGGGGGNAGSVEVLNEGDIETLGLGAFGVLAQSVGGGGGDGGHAHVINLVTAGDEPKPEDKAPADEPAPGDGTGTDADKEKESKSWSVGLAIGSGGDGAKAGDGGMVTLESDGDVVTRGTGSHALFAQSVGGGGGTGGMATTDGSGGGGDVAVELGFSLGGSGGEGGSAAEVQLANAGTLVTLGAGAHGIVAQSIGGGGGSGGASASSSKAANSDSKVAVNINAAIGGAGGVAGDGGNVAVNHEGMIDTSGARAYGVLAQSIGGGGGDGGESAAKIEADDGEDEETPPPAPDGETDDEEKVTWSVGLAIGAGGAAGAAGDGGTVQLDSSGDVVTRGIGSHALFAQSVGGGGGAGGITATDGSGGGGNVSVGLGFSLGGRAGGGGSAGPVSVKSTGTLVTLGAGAHGVVAQSIGGGGGSGGASVSSGSEASSEKQVAISLNAAIGGAGGVAGDGGRVMVQNAGLIDTSGYGAFGVLAQSVGGGGGDGGASVSMPGGGNSSHLDLGVSVGGRGGVAGRGAEVLVENAGGVVTRGEDAHAIFAQSVGGGGGSGGSSIAASGGNRGLALDFGIGGGGGAGNDGGPVTISNQGDIDTFGNESYGLLVQSVGGGGGRGGNAGVVRADAASDDGDGGADLPGRSLALSIGGAGAGASDGGLVGIDNTGDIRTRGDGSFGIFVQSIGGGGGSGGYGGYASTEETGGEATLDLQLALGGGAGSSGDGGRVDVTEAGNVVTGGEGAIAVFAQSIGGGGGTGGLGISGALGGIAIGGAGGAGGSGGTVDVDIIGSIETLGTAAFGVFAQSVGGGGGMAGNVSAGLGAYEAIGLGVAFGQDGGGGGDGGIVSVATSGDIVTHGAGASGIYAQSVGGGGGLAGNLAGTLAFAGSVGGPGSAGTVEVRHDGDIVTYGQAAHGIFAQSAAGTDAAAAVDVSVTGNVVAYGLDSSAIFAQSRGNSGAGNIRIDVSGGSAVGGPGDGAGVYLSGGAGNLLVNRGDITSVDGVEGFAVRAGSGDDAVENHGIISGSIALGGGANSLFNAADATLNTGAVLDLGSGNRLFNEGSIAPGGQGGIMATALTGDLVDSASAIHLFEVDMRGGLADSLLVTGTAEVQGVLSVGFVGPATATVQQYRLLSSTSSLDASGIQLDASLAPAALVVSIENDGMGSWLKLSPDFTMADFGLSGNQKSVGAYLNAMIDASRGVGMQKVLDSVIALQSADAVAGALEQLQPAAFTSLLTTGVFSQQRFGDALQSCRSRDGEFRFSAERECAWGRIAARDFSQDARTDTVGFDQRSYELSAGMQKAIGDQQHWFMGFGLGYEDSGLDAKPASEIDGQQLQAGAVLKGRFGATSLSLGLLGGIGDYDSSRQLLAIDPQAVASSRQDSSYYAGDLRLAYDFSGDRGYIRPQVSLGAGSMRIDGFRESGADAANLIVESQTHHFASLRPAVEVGGEFGQAGGTLWRPFARVGVTHLLDGNEQSVTARMEGAPEGVPPFVVTTEMDRTYTDVSLGLDVLRSAGLSLRIGYEGQFSGSTDQHSVQIKVWFGL